MNIRDSLAAIVGGMSRILFGGVALLALLGFAYPGGDLMVILPRIQQVVFPGFLSSDLVFGTSARQYSFITHLFAFLARFFPLSVAVFTLTLLSNGLLVYAVWRLATQLGQRRISLLSVLLVIAATGPFVMGDDIAGKSYHPQFTAYACLTMGIALLAEGHAVVALLTVAVAALFHPLIGLYGLFLVCLEAATRGFRWRRAILTSMGACAVFLLFIRPAAVGNASGASAVAWDAYVQTLIYIRAPHHHLPSAWSRSDVILSCTIVAGSILLVRRRYGFVFWAYLAALLSCVVGILNNTYFQIPSLVIAYPLRMAQVLHFFFWCFSCIFIENLVDRTHLRDTYRRRILVQLLLLVVLSVPVTRASFPANIHFDERPDQQWADVSQAAGTYLTEDACVVVPPWREDFQYRSKRSAFVTFKHFPFEPRLALEWIQRLQMLHVIPSYPVAPWTLQKRLRVDFNRFESLNDDDFRAIAKRYPFVNYCITANAQPLPFPEIYRNRAFTLYQIASNNGGRS